MNHIVQYFYIEDEKSMSKYGVNETNYRKKNEYYFRCIVNFYYSSLVYNKDSKHYFITNTIDNLNFIDKFDFYKFCKENSIEIIEKKSNHVKRNKKWAGSMYFFDAIEYFLNSGTYTKNDNYIFFDNDVLLNGNLGDMFNKIGNFNYLLYDINHEIKRENNFHDIKIEDLPSNIKAFGGEFIALKGAKLQEFIALFYDTQKKYNFLKTEEHYLSYMFINKKEIELANDYMKRIWTTFKYNNREQDDYKLYIMHIPSEKEFGLFYYNKILMRKKKYERDKALKYVSILKRPLRLKIQLLIKKVVSRLK